MGGFEVQVGAGIAEIKKCGGDFPEAFKAAKAFCGTGDNAGLRLLSSKAVIEFGPEGDVKLFRSAPGSITIDAKETVFEGQVHAKTVTVGGVPIQQYVQQIVDQMLKEKNR